jgi:hypothetical protein
LIEVSGKSSTVVMLNVRGVTDSKTKKLLSNKFSKKKGKRIVTRLNNSKNYCEVFRRFQ